MRRYLDDAGVKPENRPENWVGDDDPRKARMDEQRAVYGFDETETWSLDTAFYLWLYERLMMYKEIGGEMVDLAFHKFEYKGGEYTQIARNVVVI